MQVGKVLGLALIEPAFRNFYSWERLIQSDSFRAIPIINYYAA